MNNFNEQLFFKSNKRIIVLSMYRVFPFLRSLAITLLTNRNVGW